MRDAAVSFISYSLIYRISLWDYRNNFIDIDSGRCDMKKLLESIETCGNVSTFFLGMVVGGIITMFACLAAYSMVFGG